MTTSKNVKPDRAGFPPHGSPTGPEVPPKRCEPEVEVEVHRDRPEPAASDARADEPAAVEASEDDDADTPVLDANAPVLGLAPAFAMGTLMQTSAAAVGISHQNAVHAQNLQYALSNAMALESLDLIRGRRIALDSRIESTLDRVVRALDSLSAKDPAKSKSA